MDYGDPILLIFAAMNGAGIGNTTEYIYHRNQFSKYFMVALLTNLPIELLYLYCTPNLTTLHYELWHNTCTGKQTEVTITIPMTPLVSLTSYSTSIIYSNSKASNTIGKVMHYLCIKHIVASCMF